MGGQAILFIGNSLTATNDLPGLVGILAESLGVDSVSITSVVYGGYSLEDHWNEGTALALVRRQPWRFVVMQQGPSGLPESRRHLVAWATRWSAEIRNAGGTPVLFGVWPDRTRLTAFDSVTQSYREAAAAAGGLFAPAGLAWQDAWRRDGALPLYDEDGLHPSEEGTLLAAMTIVTVLFAQPTEALPAAITFPNGSVVRLDSARAAIFRAAAARGAAGR